MSEDLFFIVDWDLPLRNNRFAFYRRLRKLKKDFDLHGSMSSMSVLICQDRDLAFAVFHLALEYGRANIYRATRLG